MKLFAVITGFCLSLAIGAEAEEISCRDQRQAAKLSDDDLQVLSSRGGTGVCTFIVKPPDWFGSLQSAIGQPGPLGIGRYGVNSPNSDETAIQKTLLYLREELINCRCSGTKWW